MSRMQKVVELKTGRTPHYFLKNLLPSEISGVFFFLLARKLISKLRGIQISLTLPTSSPANMLTVTHITSEANFTASKTLVFSAMPA